MTEQRIAKIIKQENDSLVGVAEGMEWKVIPKPFAAKKEATVDSYVECFILHDEESDEFYLEQNPTKELSTHSEWDTQEKEYSC